MNITWEMAFAFAAAMVFAIEAGWYRSVLALGLMFLALSIMLGAGFRVG